MSVAENVNDKLTEIPFEQWPCLRDLFKNDWPEHLLAYWNIDNRIKQKIKFPTRNIQIYGLNGDWSDGTYILVDGILRGIYTLEDSCDRLKRALLLHDWSSGPRIHPYYSKHKAAVDFVYEHFGYDLEYNTHTVTWWMPKEKAMEFELNIPDDVYLSVVTPEHAESINSVWPHRFDGSVSYILDLILTNPSRGVFGKETNDLRAWILRLGNGILTALQTDKNQYRKGYASLVLKAMAKAEAMEGRDTVGCIVDGNETSTILFTKLGFQSITSTHWSRNFPVGVTTSSYSA